MADQWPGQAIGGGQADGAPAWPGQQVGGEASWPGQQIQAQPGFVERNVVTPISRGYQEFRQQMGLSGADLAKERLRQFDLIDQENFNKGFEAAYNLGKSFGDPTVEQYALATRKDQPVPGMYEELQRKRTQMRLDEQAKVTAGVEKVASAQTELEKFPVDPTIKALYDAPSWRDWAGIIISDPLVISRVGLESLPQMIPALATGVVGAPGIGSATTDTYATLLQTLQSTGVDLKDPEAVRSALLNPAIIEKAKRQAQNRGLAVGAFDQLAGLAGTLTLVPKRILERGLAGKAAELGVQTGVQMAAGAAGEAAGQQVMPGSGQGADILLEALGEVPGGVVEAAGAGAVAGKYQKSPDIGVSPASDTELGTLFSGQGQEVRPGNVPWPEAPVQSTVDLRGVIPSERPMELGPKAELPSEAVQIGARAAGTLRPAETQAETIDFYARGGMTPEVSSGVRQAVRAELERNPKPAPVVPGNTTPVYSTLRESMERKEQGLAAELAALPGFTGLRQGATGVQGGAKAVGLARRASILNTQATQAAAEGDTVRAGELRRHAARKLVQAKLEGFTYTEPFQTVIDQTVRAGVSGVARTAEAQPTAMPSVKPVGLNAPPIIGAPGATATLPELSSIQREASTLQPQAFQEGVEASRAQKEPDANPYLATEADVPSGKAWAWEKGWSYGKRLPATAAKESVVPEQQIREAGVGAAASSPFRQNPSAFENPLVALEAGLGRAATVQGPKLWSLGPAPQSVVSFVRTVKGRLLKDLNLIIDTRPDSPFLTPGSNGTYMGFRGGWGVIAISPTTLANEAQTASVLTHELGHAITHMHWANAPADVQASIYTAFGRHIGRAFGENATAEQFLEDLHSPFTLAIVKALYDRQLNQPSVDFLADSHYASWWSFDEWIAEETSKWMFTNRRVVTLLDRFFSSLGNAMERLLKILGRRLPTFTPSAEVKAWLDSMLDRRAAGQTPVTAAGTLDAYRAGVEENARALGEPATPSVPPPQAETYGMKGLDLFGFTARQKAQVDKWSWMAKVGTHLYQIAQKNPHIFGLRNYVEAARLWNAAKIRTIAQSVVRLREWRKLGKENGQRLSDFMYDVDSMSYLQPGQNARWPTPQELVALAKKHGWDKASPEKRQAMSALYSEIRTDFLQVLDRIEAAWIKHAQQTMGPGSLPGAIAQIRSEMAMLRSRPYFPHERFGDWTVTVRDQAGKVVYYAQRETKRAAVAHAKEAAHQFPGMEVTSGKLPEELQAYRGLPPSLLKSMQNSLGLTPVQQKALEGLIFDLSPANAAVKRFKRRKGTPGFSMNGQRAYAAYFQAIAGHIARMEFAGDMQAAVEEVRDSAKAMRGVYAATAQAARQGIADWLERHFTYIMNPGSELQALKSFAFFWYLGFNVKSAAINLTQIPLIAYPYMAARFGDLRTANAIRKASVDLRKTFSLKAGGLTADEIDAVKEGVSQLFLEESQAAEIAGYAQGGVLDRMLPGTGFQRGSMALSRWAGFMFQQVERANRRATFLADYRLARSDNGNRFVQEVVQANPRQYNDLLGRGWAPANAAAFLHARNAVDTTMFEYSTMARPEALRGKKGAVFAFWLYKQNYLWFLKNDPGALRAWIVLLAAAGVMGLPFAEDLKDLARWLAGMAGKDFRADEELRKWVAGWGGAEFADAALHGLSRDTMGAYWLGEMAGVPIPDVDMSASMSMGQVIPGIKGATQPGLNYKERVGAVAEQVLGAGYGIPLTALRAMESNDPNTFKMYERLMPAAARNVARMYRYLEEGGETTANGAKIAPFDITDSRSRAELVAQGLGFTPTRISRAWDERTAIQDAVKFWSIQRQMLFDQFAEAYSARDREGIADAREAIRRFNLDVPDGRLRISMEDVRKSLKARIRARRATEQGRAGSRMYEGIAREERQGFQ